MSCSCGAGGGHAGPEDCCAALMAEIQKAHRMLDRLGVPKDAVVGVWATVSGRIEWLAREKKLRMEPS